MTSTTFSGPLQVGEKTGNSQTQTIGYVKCVRQISLSNTTSRQIITLPAGATLMGLGAIRTSAITGGTDLAQVKVNFGTSADANQYGEIYLANGGSPDLTRKMQQVVIGVSAPSANVVIPAGSILVGLGAVNTSAPAGTDPVSALSYKFGNGADTSQYGLVVCSAVGQLRWAGDALVSAANIDTDTKIIVTVSALSTTVFTGGGGRAFVEYVTHSNDGTQRFIAPTSGAGNFDSSSTLVVTLSAIGTTSFTGGGVRALVEYVMVE